jgi:hypothetical protein
MGIAPLDWVDQHSWGKALKTLGEGSDADRAKVRPRGIFEMPSSPKSSRDAATLREIMYEHHYLAGLPMEATTELTTTLNAATTCLEWLQCGAQTFDFERPLMRELAETDIDDVAVDEIHVPYRLFYLRFAGSVLDSLDRPLDGLLVERRSATDEFVVINPVRRLNGRVIVDTMCMFSLSGDRSVKDSVEDEIRLTEAAATAPRARDTASGAAAADLCGEIAEGVKQLRTLLPLVVNALLYIDGCRSHIGKGWASGTPSKLAARVEAYPNAIRARDTLLRSNWREAHLCTLDAEAAAGTVRGDGIADEVRDGVRTHWRRGHWRRQAHGPGGSLRKRIRIRATIVGRSQAAAPTARTYRLQER